LRLHGPHLLNIDACLEASIATTTGAGGSTFLVTEFGKAFTANGFGNKFKD
jgi:hypothetical protein